MEEISESFQYNHIVRGGLSDASSMSAAPSAWIVSPETTARRRQQVFANIDSSVLLEEARIAVMQYRWPQAGELLDIVAARLEEEEEREEEEKEKEKEKEKTEATNALTI